MQSKQAHGDGFGRRGENLLDGQRSPETQNTETIKDFEPVEIEKETNSASAD